MTTETISTEQAKHLPAEYHKAGGSSGTVYFLGFIGACVYYIKGAATFREGVVGFLKGIVWPAFLVYDLLKFLHNK